MKPQLGIARASLATAIILISANWLRAQQATGSSPIAPLAPIQSRQTPVPVLRSNDVEPTTASVNSVNTDTHTLSSIETLGIGSIGALTNYLDPSVRFTQSGGNAGTAWDGISAIGMNLDFADHGTHSHLTGYYRGARVLYFPDGSYNSTYNNLGVAEEYSAARWVFRIREDLLSSTQAGLGGVDLTGVPTSVSTNLMSALQPSADATDTLLTARAKRLRSTTSGEVNYYLSRRSTLTVDGTYTSLTSSTAGFVSTQRTSGRIGYDYLLSAKDAVGIFYEESQIRFSTLASGLRTDSVQLAFGRRLTGRLAFQVAGGPMRIGFGAGSQQLNWAVSNSLILQSRRTQYMLSYNHSTAGGSGIFTGTTSHMVTAGASYRVTQWWTSFATAGYAFNQSLAATTGSNTQIGSWYGNVSLERAVGRHMQFSINYALQEQTAGAGVCSSAICTPSVLHQTIGATLEWHPLSIGPR